MDQPNYVKAPIKGLINWTQVMEVVGYRFIYDFVTAPIHNGIPVFVGNPKIFGKHSAIVKFDILNVLNQTRKGLSSKRIMVFTQQVVNFGLN